jgi:hypothetical protein
MNKEIKLKYGISEWSNYRLNFWNIPKCGATAVKAALLNEKISNPYDINSELHSIDKQKYIDINTALTNGFKNFTVVRDPYDRVISMYKDFGLRRPKHIKGHKNDMLKNFNYFLDEVIYKSDDKTCDPHFRSMSSYIFLNEKILVDNIFNLQNVKDFLNNYGLSFNPANMTKPLDLKLTEEHKEKINQRYKKDFDLLNLSNFC